MSSPRGYFYWFVLTFIFYLTCAWEDETFADYWSSTSKIKGLNPESFDELIGNEKPFVIMFYHIQCPVSNKFKSIYQKFAKTSENSPVEFTSMDIRLHSKFKKKNNIRGTPTVRYYPASGSTEYDHFGEERALINLVTWLNGHLGSNVVEAAVKFLDPENFVDIVMDPTRSAMVYFCLPKSSTESLQALDRCRKARPKFEEAAESFPGEDITFGYVNAAEYPEFSQEYVRTYPTYVFFSKDNEQTQLKAGLKNSQQLVEYINKKIGSKRMVGGGIEQNIGLIPELDVLVNGFVNSEDKKKLLDKACMIADAHSDSLAEYYVSAMKGVAADGIGFLYKESYRLKKIMKKDDSDIPDTLRRLNIVNSMKG